MFRFILLGLFVGYCFCNVWVYVGFKVVFGGVVRWFWIVWYDVILMLCVFDNMIIFLVVRFMFVKMDLSVVILVVGVGSLLVMLVVEDISLFLCFKGIFYVIFFLDNCKCLVGNLGLEFI